MFIQIDHTNFINKGAELMLYSIIERLSKEKQLNPKFIFGRGWCPDRSVIRKAGLYQNIKLKKLGLDLTEFIKDKHLEQYGLVKSSKLNVMLDAGGFRIGDPWINSYSIKFNKQEEKYFKKLKKFGTKIIFLPQAFGPFKQELSRDLVKRIFNYTDLIFARDRQSYNYLTEFLEQDLKILTAPDFTNLFIPDENKILKKVVDIAENSIIIIPNRKMMTHTNSKTAEQYENFLGLIAQKVENTNYKLVLLNHEGQEDKKIIDTLKAKLSIRFNKEIYVLDNLDAVNVKAAIGKALFVVSSRFHGVVSALSQGVPVLCTSWNHKYQELLNDYDLKEGLLEISNQEDAIEKFNNLLNLENNVQIREKLLNKSKNQKDLAESMWQKVINFVES